MAEWRVSVASAPLEHDESWEALEEEFLETLEHAGLAFSVGLLPVASTFGYASVPQGDRVISGIVGWGRVGELGAVFALETMSLAEAGRISAEILEATLVMMGRPGTAARLEVEPFAYDAEELEDAEDRVGAEVSERRIRIAGRSVPVLTASDVGRELGVSRQRVYQLKEAGGFPQPVATTRRGAVWDATAVRAWARAANRSPGRPRQLQAR